MASKDLFHSIAFENAKSDTGIDTQGYLSVTFAIVATGTAKVVLLEGDTKETLKEVSMNDYLGQPIDTKELGLFKVGYRGNKRYVGVKVTGEATAIAILGHPYIEGDK